MKNFILVPVFCAVVSLTACSSRQITQSPSVALSPQIQDQAIVNNIKSSVESMSKRGWVVEQIDANKVVAGLDFRGHYLQVTYVVEQHKVASQITNSQNFHQKGTEIHRNALKLKAKLDRRVFQKLARL